MMDPTRTFCPNLACAARGQTGQGNIGIHSRKEQRFLCTECRKTFTATNGTAFYRLRTAAETVSLVVTLLAMGVHFKRLSWRLAMTNGQSQVGWPALASKDRPSRNIWWSNRVTWDRSKPMRSVSRRKGRSYGWPSP